MDMQAIHPAMQCDPNTPLHALAGWEPDRLARVSRWNRCPPGKEVIRNYARVVMALAELHASAQSVAPAPGAVLSGKPNLHKQSRNSKLIAPAPTAPAAGMSSALALPSAASVCVKPPVVQSQARATLPGGRWIFATPNSLSAEFVNIWRSWSTVASCCAQWLLVLLAWLPIVLMIVAVAVVVTDPLLLGRLCWESLRAIPVMLRTHLAPDNGHGAPRGPDFYADHNVRTMTVASADPPPRFAHPMDVPSQAGGGSAISTVIATLAAEGGGAGLLWALISRGWVAAPVRAAP